MDIERNHVGIAVGRLLFMVSLFIVTSCDEIARFGDSSPKPSDLSQTWLEAGIGSDSIVQQDNGALKEASVPKDANTPAPDQPLTGPSCDKTQHKGEGTYYAADGTGNCSFDKSSDLMVAAMNQIDYDGSNACGACISATGPNGTVKVRIVDRCPECLKGDVDFSKEAFGKIAAISAGRVPITWSYVPCNVTGPIRYHFKSGSNQWWTAVQVRDHRHAVATFEVHANGAFVKVSRVNYNFFVQTSGMGPGPYTFRVTDIYGQQLTDKGIPLTVGGVEKGTGQFPPCKP